MELYRLSRFSFSQALSGVGASIKGARWNSPGVELVYTSSNRSLAMAEVAVHLTMATLPDDFMMITIHVPGEVKIKEVSVKSLPPDWKDFPHPPSTQKFGDGFVNENKYCILKIPSVITKGDYNFLLNPKHRDFKKIKITSVEKFPFDKRIFK